MAFVTPRFLPLPPGFFPALAGLSPGLAALGPGAVPGFLALPAAWNLLSPSPHTV